MIVCVVKHSDVRAGGGLDELNLAILEQLSQSVTRGAAKLVLADASGFYGDSGNLPRLLDQFARRHGAFYVNVGGRLAQAHSADTPSRFRYDGHLNEQGNRVFAEAMFDWFKTHGED